MIFKFEELNWKELDAMDRTKTMFFLPVSPLEEHGPHLPIGVDFINADFFARETAEVLANTHADWNFILIPALALGAHVIDYVGSIRIRQRVIRDLLVDYGSSLARHGFKYIVVFNAHAAPGHIVALEEACEAVNRKYNIQMVSPTGRFTIKLFLGEYYERFNKYMPKPMAAELIKDMKKDFHAGLWETSMMLMFRPDLVKEDYKSLEPHLKEMWEVLTNSEGCSNESGGYLGIPASASIEFARASTRVMRDEFFSLLERMMKGQNIRREVTSVYSWVPFLKTDFWSNVALLT
ncbi:MAG: creatininase family protein, partial [Armatimonadetes bacterium]|nr:creatininase family protein [Armatimonadota bacterium]